MMDDLQKAWQAFSEDDSEETLHLDQNRESALPILKMKKQLRIKMAFIVGIALIWLVFVVFYPTIEVRIPFAILLFAYIIGGIMLFIQMRKLRTGSNADENLSEFLKSSLSQIKRILKAEEQLALTIYPISATAGFMVGFAIEESIDTLFEERIVLYLLFASIVVITPISHWLGKWMNKKAFGKYIQSQEQLIDSLKIQNRS